MVNNIANYNNHLIDPTYFYDVIEEFSFDYDIYVKIGIQTDDYFRQISKFEKQSIRGSLQIQELNKRINKSGNVENCQYKFYCKSLYRINIGDVILYKNNYLLVTSIQEYDEWGVREATLEMIQLSSYKDLAEYIKYIKGDIII